MTRKQQYAARKAAGKCAILSCRRMAKDGVKCQPHRLSAKRSAEKSRRAKGMLVMGSSALAKSLGMLSQRSKEIVAALAKIPQCACGLRHHPPCDLIARRLELPTAGLGSWA